LKVRDKLGIVGIAFNDLRGKAVTRLAIAGCEVPEIAKLAENEIPTAETAIEQAHQFANY
jgi:hypothetical protein